jgi:hypothetical protein
MMLMLTLFRKRLQAPKTPHTLIPLGPRHTFTFVCNFEHQCCAFWQLQDTRYASAYAQGT